MGDQARNFSLCLPDFVDWLSVCVWRERDADL